MLLIIILNSFHFLAPFLAGGLGVGHSLLFKEHQLAKEAPCAVIQKTMIKLARIGLVALMLLWITGFGLSH